MTSTSLQYSRFRKTRIWVLAALLLLAQLGVASHPLHGDANKLDSVCAFCIVGTHLEAAPCLPSLQLEHSAPDSVIGAVAYVFVSQPTATSRLTRGPPQFAFV